MARKTSAPHIAVLLKNALTIMLRERHVAIVLMAAYAWVNIVGARIARPFLLNVDIDSPGSIVIAELGHNIVLYGFALAMGILWVRAFLIAPEHAWDGGWTAFFRRWGRMLGHFGTAILCGTVCLLCAILISALIGNIGYLLAGDAIRSLQIPLMVIILAPPVFLVLSALWTSLLFEATDHAISYHEILRFALRGWRMTLPLMALVVFSNIALSFTILSLSGTADGLDPATLGGTIGLGLAGFFEMGLVILAITTLALLLPVNHDQTSRA